MKWRGTTTTFGHGKKEADRICCPPLSSGSSSVGSRVWTWSSVVSAGNETSLSDEHGDASYLISSSLKKSLRFYAASHYHTIYYS